MTNWLHQLKKWKCRRREAVCIVHVHTMHSHPVCPLHGVRALGCLFSVLWDSHLPRPEDQRAGRLWSAQLPPLPPLPPPSSRLFSRLQRQRPRLPLAHLSATHRGLFVTTLVCPQTQTMPCLLCLCCCFIPSPPTFHCAPLAARFVPLCPRYDPWDKWQWWIDGGEQQGLTSAAIVLCCNELACYQDPHGLGSGSGSSVFLPLPAHGSAVHSAPARLSASAALGFH